LDVAFGGDGDDRYDPDYVMSYYKTLWGGVYGGYAHSTSVNTTGSNAYYWSSTADGSDNAYNLGFYTSGGVYPQYVNSKYYGFQVRCVK
jgi:uncharacterized protein (TIGR02145 family)